MEDELVRHVEAAEEELGVLGELTVAGERVAARAREAWTRIRDAVGAVLGGVIEQVRFMLDAGADDPDEMEREQLRASALAVTHVLGDAPVERLRGLAPDDRMNAVAALVSELCQVLGIEEPTLVRAELGEGCWGACYAQVGVVVFNDTLCTLERLTDEQATELIDTVCHELYHAFQYRACRTPSAYGISKTQARIWRLNFKEYIDADVNPRRYWSQPLEVTARIYASSVLAVLGIA